MMLIFLFYLSKELMIMLYFLSIYGFASKITEIVNFIDYDECMYLISGY